MDPYGNIVKTDNWSTGRLSSSNSDVTIRGTT